MHEKTKACKITRQTKEKVYLRDGGHCVLCGRWCQVDNASAHYISRARGGLGIEENILTLCHECHYSYDNANRQSTRKEKEDYFRNYLRSKYEDWDERRLTFDKWGFFKTRQNSEK